MPLRHRTANDGPDVRDRRTPIVQGGEDPPTQQQQRRGMEPPLPAIDRAIRTAILDGRTAPMTCPRLASSFQAQTCRAGVKIACTARTLAALSRCIPLAYWNEGRYHILFEYSDTPCLPGMQNTPFLQRKYLVTFRGTTKSARSHAMRNHLSTVHNGRDIVLVCACRWFDEERMGREGEEEELNKYTYTDLALETKFGLIIMAAGTIPVIVVDHYVLPYQDLLDWETFSIRIPEHRLLELPRILRSIPDEVVEMMQRRVVFMFEEFFKSISTQVHTALESARINLFSGDNAWQRALEPAAVTPPSTNNHCSGGMNRRALPCDDHPATLCGCGSSNTSNTPQHKQASDEQRECLAVCLQLGTGADGTSCVFGWKQQQAEAMRTHRQQDEGNVEDTCHACQLHSPHTCCNHPDSAAVAVLMQCSHMREQATQLCAARPSPSSPSSPSTAQPPSHAGRHQPQSGVRQTLHMSLALMKSVGEANEAVEPTTMTMTSDEATTADVWLHLDERALCILSISSSSSPSLVPNSSGCGHGCGGCIARRCAVVTTTMMVVSGLTVAVLFPGPHDTSRAIHAHTNVQEKKARGG
ncbi:hypothetical protein PTSG_10278 [Salpingoeca rosetta]|uniref:Exostosin GT47 domain-containing protein n=1 Tax=Salpingoeca rosetta (strain ATCC 50818 / BSB-021) TaxID=946362 RepID=F2UQU7_SALR5|nr:uncharacterized protein PTSG_10278 [Salpingoeca rosetta]EGD80002.1 hypothetical protein PTSG_10278 [Salpingoeca rosetta]|eukprot:XP_004988327.1 hypothetical protein PTSG_10278 [Salpingoeca rosetta]